MKAADHAEMPNRQFRRRAVAVAQMDRAGFDDEALQECVDGEVSRLIGACSYSKDIVDEGGEWHLWLELSGLAGAPPLEIRNHLILGEAPCGQRLFQTCDSLLESRPFRFGAPAAGGDEVSDSVAVTGDGYRRVARHKVCAEIFAKLTDSYGNGFHR